LHRFLGENTGLPAVRAERQAQSFSVSWGLNDLSWHLHNICTKKNPSPKQKAAAPAEAQIHSRVLKSAWEILST
jgi:hypothetical protein